MAKWDVFHVREFEQAFGVEEDEVRRLLREGKLRGDDCLRITGDEQWIRISAIPKFHQDLKPASKPVATPKPPPAQAPVHRVRLQPPAKKPQPQPPAIQDAEPGPEPPSTRKAAGPPKPVVPERPAPPPADTAVGRRRVEQPREERRTADEPDDEEWETIEQEPAPNVQSHSDQRTPRWATEPEADLDDEESEEEEGGFFALARRRSQVEELDLTAMVDVTFLLVLFFMITATYTLQESIDVPAPDPEQKKAQQAIQNLDDLREDYIVVTINADNTLEVDGERVGAEFSTLVNRIRRINRESSRNELVIYADPVAFHETVVLVYDAANEVGMQRIRLAAEAGGG